MVVVVAVTMVAAGTVVVGMTTVGEVEGTEEAAVVVAETGAVTMAGATRGVQPLRSTSAPSHAMQKLQH